jgi:hypothetical protein
LNPYGEKPNYGKIGRRRSLSKLNVFFLSIILSVTIMKYYIHSKKPILFIHRICMLHCIAIELRNSYPFDGCKFCDSRSSSRTALIDTAVKAINFKDCSSHKDLYRKHDLPWLSQTRSSPTHRFRNIIRGRRQRTEDGEHFPWEISPGQCQFQQCGFVWK